MNSERPHDIRHFAPGETIPGGYVPLTDAEATELELMNERQRAEWIKRRKERDLRKAIDAHVRMADACKTPASHVIGVGRVGESKSVADLSEEAHYIWIRLYERFGDAAPAPNEVASYCSMMRKCGGQTGFSAEEMLALYLEIARPGKDGAAALRRGMESMMELARNAGRGKDAMESFKAAMAPLRAENELRRKAMRHRYIKGEFISAPPPAVQEPHPMKRPSAAQKAKAATLRKRARHARKRSRGNR